MDLISRPVLAPDYRLAYGSDPSQFGDLWLPPRHGRELLPVVVFFHGGWWKSEYGLGYAGYLCAALRRAGIATWSVEYRRVGATGGGWPHTFQDAAAGFDHLRTVARSYPLDLSRVITVGHSAGGHLAFWIAGRQHLPVANVLAVAPTPMELRGTVSLAGAVDLRLTIALSGEGIFAHDRDEVYRLMGGSPEEVPSRYQVGNPGDLLPFQAPQILVQGIADDQIPPDLPARWVAQASRLGSHASTLLLPGADHFDVVDPESNAWPAVEKAIVGLLAESH